MLLYLFQNVHFWAVKTVNLLAISNIDWMFLRGRKSFVGSIVALYHLMHLSTFNKILIYKDVDFNVLYFVPIQTTWILPHCKCHLGCRQVQKPVGKVSWLAALYTSSQPHTWMYLNQNKNIYHLQWVTGTSNNSSVIRDEKLTLARIRTSNYT